jgi:flagellar basal-body rod protein FlgB
MAQIFNLSDTLHHAMDYHVERHNVLASNIANIDTPGFRPFELLRDSDSRIGGSLPMATSNERHLLSNGSEAVQGNEPVVVEDATAPTGADGNSVGFEHEMSKLSANDLRYQSVSRLISRHLAMLRYAASDTSSG